MLGFRIGSEWSHSRATRFKVGRRSRDGIRAWLSQTWDVMAAVKVSKLCVSLECVCFPPHQAGTLGCPIPKELGQFSGWKLCMGLPEDASPFSFRSILGHNTNIWAAKTTNFIPLIPFKVRTVRAALGYSNMPE